MQKLHCPYCPKDFYVDELFAAHIREHQTVGNTLYPKSFIEWLHGMTDKTFTDRMYVRWRMETKQSH